MEWWQSFIFGGLLSLFYQVGWYRGRRTKKLPYKWSCKEEGCVFEVSSDDPTATLSIADNHAEYHRHKD